MFKMEAIIGTLFSATMVRLASIGIALFVAYTVGSEVYDLLNAALDAFPASRP